jgi:hypothetical protein
MKHNVPMGLIDRILKPGKDKGEAAVPAPPPAQPPSTQFYESESDAGDLPAERNTRWRELVQVVLRDTMRKHGIPSDWVECRILSAVTRSGRRGLHVNFVVRQAHEQLLPYVFAFQDSFESELRRFEPRCRDWLLSLGWEFMGFKASDMPDPKSWPQATRVAAPATAPAPAAAPAPAPAPVAEPSAAQAGEPSEPARSDDIQRDLEALFAIRDAALAEAAHHGSSPTAQPDFQPTQPAEDRPPPRR